MKQKVFGIGFQKTGTSSLHEALEILGYNARGTRPDLLGDILSGKFSRTKKFADRFDALSDHPWPNIYRWLDNQYPGSKFILTIRDPDSWIKSVGHHIGNSRSPIHEWIYGKGKGIPNEDPKHAIRVYQNHNEAVKAYFRDRPDDLLILHIPNELNWDKLCTFLELPIPSEPFPHSNKGNYTSVPGQEKFMSSSRKFRVRFKNYLLLRYYYLRGWI